jgi:hypothetical protein
MAIPRGVLCVANDPAAGRTTLICGARVARGRLSMVATMRRTIELGASTLTKSSWLRIAPITSFATLSLSSSVGSGASV